MLIQGLTDYKTAQTFRPFSITVADGSRHEVQHREMIAIGLATCVVYRGPSEAIVQLDEKLMTEVCQFDDPS